jgi:hypothetical protein
MLHSEMELKLDMEVLQRFHTEELEWMTVLWKEICKYKIVNMLKILILNNKMMIMILKMKMMIWIKIKIKN